MRSDTVVIGTSNTDGRQKWVDLRTTLAEKFTIESTS